jgi:hypothetical protein
MKYKVYSKMYEQGKPKGRAYLVTRTTFGSRSAALNYARKSNAEWNRGGKLKELGIQAKVDKVVAVRKRVVRRANAGARSGLKFLGLR